MFPASSSDTYLAFHRKELQSELVSNMLWRKIWQDNERSLALLCFHCVKGHTYILQFKCSYQPTLFGGFQSILWNSLRTVCCALILPCCNFTSTHLLLKNSKVWGLLPDSVYNIENNTIAAVALENFAIANFSYAYARISQIALHLLRHFG